MIEIKALIVDDEIAARNVLFNLLELLHPEVKVLDRCSNLEEGVESIKRHKPDLVFLDVEMPRFSGIEIKRFFETIDFQIIFITAYEQYAVEAFSVEAVDYLLKPIERPRLKMALDRVKARLKEERELEEYKTILEKAEEEESSTIVLSEIGIKRLVKTSEVLAVMAKGAYSEVFVEGEKSIVVSRNIGKLEEELKVNSNFFRVHKSWLINLKAIQSYRKSEGTIELRGGLVCKLSRFKKAEFEAAIFK